MSLHDIKKDDLRRFAEAGLTSTEIATHYNCSARTVRRRLKKYNISLREARYTEIASADLVSLVKDLLELGHEYGEVSVDGILRSKGIFVKRERLRRILRILTPSTDRQARKIKRRDYWCLSPLSVVHIDGNHKLIPWRLVVHGAIDGFSRKIFYIGISDNNRASTVVNLFKKAVYRYGLPSRVRMDKGKENIKVIEYMLNHRGTDRNSCMAGRSVHNTRIERLWVDLRKRCIGVFRRRFIEMENNGLLDSKNETDLYCLHLCFKPLLVKELQVFRLMWNEHKHRGLKSRSPNWVFETGLKRLRTYAAATNQSFTEIRQRNWKAIDDRQAEEIDQSDENLGISVPRIRRPISLEQHEALKRAIRQFDVNWNNSVEKFCQLREQVWQMMEENESSENS